MSDHMREGQTFSGVSRWITYANFVKLPHTVFLLPFALVGVTFASAVTPVTGRIVAWVIVAFTAARFAAMGFNRVVDREIDARNPRTAGRELPRGALRVAEARWAVTLASLLFVGAAWMLNPLCFALSPLALAWVFFYSYTKRFTRWSHLVLGFGLSIAPVGGYLAVTGHWSQPWWMLVTLASAVAGWSGGFDILYALQDAAFDRAHGLYSLPASLGEAGALRVARALHVIAVGALFLTGIAIAPGWLYWAGWVTVVVLLGYEHSLVRANDLSRLDAAFFTLNGIILDPVPDLRRGRPRRARLVTPDMTAPLVFGITGASGAPYAVRALQALAAAGQPVALIISSHGVRLLHTEMGIQTLDALREAVGGAAWDQWVTVHDDRDRGAGPASGSFASAGMLVCPCSMGTLSAIAAGSSRSLIERAADVTLKERRRLVLVPRETPLSEIHLRNMLRVTRAGAVVLPAAPGFYHRPSTVDALVDFVVARILDHVGVPQSLVPRWAGTMPPSR